MPCIASRPSPKEGIENLGQILDVDAVSLILDLDRHLAVVAGQDNFDRRTRCAVFQGILDQVIHQATQ